MSLSIALFRIVLCFLIFLPQLLPANPIVFPDDASCVDVTKSPYSAVGNGKTDCTAAIQQALDDDHFVYLPAGTYLVSDVLMWGVKEPEAKRKIIQGAGRDLTRIQLADAAPGFDNAWPLYKRAFKAGEKIELPPGSMIVIAKP